MKADKEKLLRKIWEDDAFAKKLMAIEDGAAGLNFLHENGINVTEEDLKQMAEKAAALDWTKLPLNGRELPDEMLENVAGGTPKWIKDAWHALEHTVMQPITTIKQLFTCDVEGLEKAIEETSDTAIFDAILGGLI